MVFVLFTKPSAFPKCLRYQTAAQCSHAGEETKPCMGTPIFSVHKKSSGTHKKYKSKKASDTIAGFFQFQKRVRLQAQSTTPAQLPHLHRIRHIPYKPVRQPAVSASAAPRLLVQACRCVIHSLCR